ncbi:hypothetical protein GRAQ_04746 [Rahnella aquatilis CIP 78.65 = ATCC 33071]|nr:hypothetical protein GRAQ_04746 [Rahnella aquatilis CIP 78.65 = ATCC 33071]
MEAFPAPDLLNVETLSDPWKASSYPLSKIIFINQIIKIVVTMSLFYMWNVFLIKDDDVRDVCPQKTSMRY